MNTRRGNLNILGSQAITSDVNTDYEKRLREVQRALGLLQDDLRRHAVAFKKDGHYGHVGDLGYVLEQLGELHSFLT